MEINLILLHRSPRKNLISQAIINLEKEKKRKEHSGGGGFWDDNQELYGKQRRLKADHISTSLVIPMGPTN